MLRSLQVELSTQEITLLEAFRQLPADDAGELSALIQRLAAVPPSHRIDWSGAWAEEDLRDFTHGSLTQFEAEEDPR